MIFCIVAVLAAFYWLMCETKWLTVRLPFGRPIEEINLAQLISVMMAVAIGVNLIPTLVKLPGEDIVDVGGKK